MIKKLICIFIKSVGYEAMWNLINGLFPSLFTTSLREYFAIGFEDYFMKEKNNC
jgi:hypothetical protein